MTRMIQEPCVYIFSGAGLSAESGIPTFRSGTDALWDGYDPSHVCDIQNFEKYYNESHQFYNDRREQFANAKPNDAHFFIAEWENKYGTDRVINHTTNIDLLLENAGCTNVHHIHGRADQLVRGWNHKTSKGTHIENIGSNPVDYKLLQSEGELVKPNVVFFGESCLHTDTGTELLYQHMYNTLCDIKESDTVIVIGASGVVVPFHLAMNGSPWLSININPSTEHANYFNYNFHTPVTQCMSAVDTVITQRMNTI